MHRLGRATTAILLVLSGVAIGAGPPAAATSHLLPRLDVVTGLAIELSNVVVTPSAPRRHELLHISGIARASEPVDVKQIWLRVPATPLTSRDELHAAAADPAQLLGTVPERFPGVGQLTPGTDLPWAVDIPVDDLHLSFGVYRLAIDFFDAKFFSIGRVNTFLPFLPPGDWQPTNVAWVWPLIDAPRRVALAQPQSLLKSPTPSVAPTPTDGSLSSVATATSGDVFLDDSLATALGPDGSLGALVAGAATAAKQHKVIPPRLAPLTVPPAGKAPGAVAASTGHALTPPVVEKLVQRGVPVTWAIDPDLLETAQSMAGGYAIRDSSGTHQGATTSVQTAANWLKAVTSAVGSGPVIPLPYSDADLVALARAGLKDEISSALRPSGDADSVFRSVLSRQVAPSIVWPVNGSLTQVALDILARLQVSAVVLSDSSLPIRNPDELTATPGMQGPPLTAGGGTVQPLVSDQTLDGLIAADPSPAEMGLADQRFLAETAMITAEAPSRARDILLLPPRHPTNTTYLSSLLALTGQVPWLNGITVDDALRHDVDPTERGPLIYPQADKAAEVSRAVVTATADARARLAMLHSILTTPEVLNPTDRGLLRTYSASWRQDARMAESVRSSADREVKDWINKVSVLTSQQTLTLLSKSAKIPLTITNGLDQKVHGLRLRLTADNPAYMNEVRADNVSVPAHDRSPLFLPATIPAVGSVRFGAVVSLLNQQGQLLSQVRLTVHSTGGGGTVLLVTLILMGLLFLVVAIRLVLRAWKFYAARRAVA